MAIPGTNTSESGTPGDASQRGSGMMNKVRERAAAQLSTQKDKATDGLGSVAQAVRQSTRQLRDEQHDTLAGYVERAADQIDRLSQQLRDKDVGELFEEAQRLARRRPALFIGSAFAVGVFGARFFKSSSRADGDYERASSYRDSSYPHMKGSDLSSASRYAGPMSGGTGPTGTSESNVGTAVGTDRIGTTGSTTASTPRTGTGTPGTGTASGATSSARTAAEAGRVRRPAPDTERS
jgi:hypothetical protein